MGSSILSRGGGYDTSLTLQTLLVKLEFMLVKKDFSVD